VRVFFCPFFIYLLLTLFVSTICIFIYSKEIQSVILIYKLCDIMKILVTWIFCGLERYGIHGKTF